MHLDCPIQIYRGDQDKNMAPAENVRWLKNKIGDHATISAESADHFGLIYGKRAAEQMWPKIIKFLSGGE